jgi:HD-like signal output (HDOD) protein
MASEQIRRRIAAVIQTLPPLPTVTQKLLAVVRDENSSADDVTRVLTSDQALAGKLLKLVNSSFYGAPGEIGTITRAVVLLGFSGVRNLALGLGTVEAMRKIAGDRDLRDFWEHSLITAAAAQTLAEHADAAVDPEEAFVAGLLHDVGHLILAAAVPDEYGELLDGEGGDIVAREKAALGMAHTQVAQKIMHHWKLPAPLCDAARFHHTLAVAASGEQPLTACVGLGDALACVHGGAFEPPPGESTLQKLSRSLALTLDDVRATLEGMTGKIEETKVFLSLAGEDVGATAAPEEARLITVISTDPERSRWAQTLVQYFGHRLLPMKSFFARAEGYEEVALVLLDPQCVTRNQLSKILPFVDGLGASLALLAVEEETGLTQGLRDRYPVLSYVFSRADCERLLHLQPA